MSYANYAILKKIDNKTWNIFLNQVRILFKLLGNKHNPIYQNELIFFEAEFGDTFEPFYIEKGKYGYWSCVTNKLPYDLTVKCVLVLLAELGGIKHMISSSTIKDQHVVAEWRNAITYLSSQWNLPNDYPRTLQILNLS